MAAEKEAVAMATAATVATTGEGCGGWWEASYGAPLTFMRRAYVL
jgi:hypothetical protein